MQANIGVDFMEVEPPFDFEPPPWLPASVHPLAKSIYERATSSEAKDQLALLSRLATDERMKRVWRELVGKGDIAGGQKFSGPNEFYEWREAAFKREKAAECREKGGDRNNATADLLEFKAPATTEPPVQSQTPQGWSGNDCAAYCFFHSAFHIGRDLEPLTKRENLRHAIAGYHEIKQQIHRLARELRSIGLEHYEGTLAQIARDVREIASQMTDNSELDILVVDRERRDLRLQSYVVQLAQVTSAIFGSALYRTIATTATVALELEERVTGPQIRHILDKFPEYEIAKWVS